MQLDAFRPPALGREDFLIAFHELRDAEAAALHSWQQPFRPFGTEDFSD